jgi:hypothetical protein
MIPFSAERSSLNNEVTAAVTEYVRMIGWQFHALICSAKLEGPLGCHGMDTLVKRHDRVRKPKESRIRNLWDISGSLHLSDT